MSISSSVVIAKSTPLLVMLEESPHSWDDEASGGGDYLIYEPSLPEIASSPLAMTVLFLSSRGRLTVNVAIWWGGVLSILVYLHLKYALWRKEPGKWKTILSETDSTSITKVLTG